MFSQDKFTFGRRLNINLVALGPAGTGKSTLMGQLLTITKQVTHKDEKSVEQYLAGCGKSKIRFHYRS